MKVCHKCKVEKPLTEFYKDKTKKDGHGYKCKSCKKEYKAKYYTENKEELAKYYAKYYAENKEYYAKYHVKYRAENKEEITKQSAKYYAENKEKIAKQQAKYRAGNKEEITKYNAKYYAGNKEEITKYNAQYYAENKEKIKENGRQLRVKNKAEQPNCVYQIKNLENNKVYIGETTRGKLRWKDHLKCLRGGYHGNKLLQADFDKYGEEAFEWSILKEFEDGDKDNLLLEEARSIRQFITEGVELYNLTLTIDQLKMLTENK